MRHVRHAGEVRGVVQGGGELRDAAADRGVRVPVQDDAGLHVALRGAARAGVAVEGERLARVHNGPVDGAGHQRNVGAGRARVATGGERSHHVVERGVFRLRGGELRRHVLVHRIPLAGLSAQHTFVEAVHGRVPVHHGAVHRRLNPAAFEHPGVLALHLGLRELLAEDGAGGVLVHARRDTAVHHGELHDLPEAVLRHRGRELILAGDGDRAVQGRPDGTVERGLHRGLVDGGLHLRRLDLHAVRVEPAGGDLVAQCGALHVLARLRVLRFGLAAFDADDAVGGVHVQLANQPVQLMVQRDVIDGGHNVHLTGGKQPAQALDRVGGRDAGGVHGRVEIDA